MSTTNENAGVNPGDGDEAKELADWQREWQELGGEKELATELVTRVARDGRRIRRGVIIEILATLFSSTLCIWFMSRSRGELVTIVVCAGILVFNGVWVTRLLTLREGTLRARRPSVEGKGLDAFVELTRRRLNDDLKWNTFATWTTRVLAIALVPWSIWAYVARFAMYKAEPWRAIVGFGTAFGILLVLFVVQRRKRKKLVAEVERFEGLVAERSLA